MTERKAAAAAKAKAKVTATTTTDVGFQGKERKQRESGGVGAVVFWASI